MQIRKFHGRDFEPVSKIMGATWYADQGSRSYWLGAEELCIHLMKSDYALTAVDEKDQVLGVVLVRSPRDEDHDSQLRGVWQQQLTNLEMMMRMLAIDVRSALSLVHDEGRLMDNASDTFDNEGIGVMPLVIVAPEARGQGVAKALLRAGLDWLMEHGTTELRLVTSDDCDWQVYERWGMRRVLAAKSSAEPSIGIYVYQGLPQLEGHVATGDRVDRGNEEKGARNMKIEQMVWTREPKEWAAGDDVISITTEPGTDLWQRTYYHFRNDNAPVLQLETDEPYFSFVVRTDFSGAGHRFDQCGVAIYLDSDNWIKGSVEYEDGVIQHLGSVVTNHGWSDWATTEIPADVRQMWYRLSRREDDYRIDCCEDGEHWRQMRVCHLHEGLGTIRVGVYACSPEDSSFTARFTDLSLGPCAWEAHDGQQPDEDIEA